MSWIWTENLSFGALSLLFSPWVFRGLVGYREYRAKRVLEVSNELRCLVCQNQTIADSNADLAVDLKNQVRQQLSEGRSKQEILNYMTERYGDFVLYNPPFNAATLMLWVGPFLLMLLGLIVLVRQIKQRKQELSKETFSAQEIERARQLLDRKLGNQ
ncbi:MAG: cytochrome c-type biogenesis protein CcmH [Burkholderiaceae bacterium]|nr:cytochrome c-type biogenesis protein CcmH [Burkholderiaceae bacterium]